MGFTALREFMSESMTLWVFDSQIKLYTGVSSAVGVWRLTQTQIKADQSTDPNPTGALTDPHNPIDHLI